MTLSGRAATATIVVLVLSVCLNVFIAGLVAGRLIGRDPAPDGRPGAGLERFIATVPAEARPVIHRALRENRFELQRLGAAVQEARLNVAGTLAVEPFDRAAFEDALATLRMRSKALEAEVHRAIADAITQLPPEARAEMAARWSSRP